MADFLTLLLMLHAFEHCLRIEILYSNLAKILVLLLVKKLGGAQICKQVLKF